MGRFKASTCLGLAFSSILASVSALAGPYQFGGGNCSANGNFTRDALAQADQIRGALEQIRDNPKCSALYNAAQPLIQRAISDMQSPGGAGGDLNFQRMMSLPSEISSLRRFSAAGGEMRQNVLNLLVQKNFEAAQYTAEDLLKQGAAKADLKPDEKMKQLAAGVNSLATRTDRALQSGVNALTTLMPALADARECIESNNTAGMALFATSVQTLATFAANDSGLGTRLSGAIASMGEMLRRKEIAEALRKLNKNEFWTSASCLLETTTENYCETLDQRTLLQNELEEMVKAKEKAQHDGNHPLSGLYVMMRDVPNVTNWLRELRTGVEPRWESDAQRLQGVMQTLNSTSQTALGLKGSFNQNALIIKNLPAGTAQRLRTVDLVASLVGKIAGFKAPGGLGGGGTEENFFMTSKTELELPFFLIGYKGVPKVVDPLNTDLNKQAADWMTWMKNHAEADPYFKDSDALLSTINNNISIIIDAAYLQVSTYFINQMSVDPRTLVTKATIGQVVTVQQSLKNIHNYLGHLYAVLEKDPARALSLDLIKSTYHRIDRVLKAFDALAANTPKGLHAGDNTLLSDTEADKSYKALIELAFVNFNMLMQLDNFFRLRISPLVMDDLARKTGPGSNLSKYDRDVLMATGDDLVGRMLRLMGKDPTAARIDLDQALVTGKNNIAAMEQYFGPRLYPMFDELSVIASGRVPTADILNSMSRKRAGKDYFNKNAKSQVDYLLKNINPIRHIAYQLPYVGHKAANSHLYPLLSNAEYTALQEDQFGSFGQVLARMCIQSQAFTDPAQYKEYCDGKVLESALEPYRLKVEPNAPSLNVNYDDGHYSSSGGDSKKSITSAMSKLTKIAMAAALDKKKVTPEYLRDQSICSLHRFKIRNAVYSMTLESQRRADEQAKAKMKAPPVPVPSLDASQPQPPPPAPAAAPAVPAPGQPQAPAAPVVPAPGAPVAPPVPGGQPAK